MPQVNAILAALVVLVVVLAFAYEKGWLNKYLPAKWQKNQKASFVGAYGRTPGMQNCLAFSDPDQRWPHFNRCTWV